MAQLVRGDIIAMQHKVSKLGNSSLALDAIMLHEDNQQVVCTAREVLVLYDFAKREKASIPQRQSFIHLYVIESSLITCSMETCPRAPTGTGIVPQARLKLFFKAQPDI